MKIMILADSHWMDRHSLINLIKHARDKYQAQYFLHCGDIFVPYHDLNISRFYNVKGNNDMGDIPEQRILEIDHLRFLMVHGHIQGIDYGTGEMEALGKENKADVVCFGHTHSPYYQIKDGIIYLNPGSTTFPRGKYPNPTYIIFDTQTKEVMFIDVKKDESCDPFQKQSYSLFNLFKNINKG